MIGAVLKRIDRRLYRVLSHWAVPAVCLAIVLLSALMLGMEAWGGEAQRCPAP